MRTVIAGVLVALSLAAAYPAAAQQQQGDAAEGRAFAQRSCSSCHAVDPAAAARTDAAPSFQTLANTRSVASLTGWLMEPHPPMPTLTLTVTEIRNIVAFISSLRTQR